jgi:hypothetical protein
MTWHKSDRKQDHMLRHPTDGSQWRKIDRKYKDFVGEARNIRFGLSTDGLNPFGEFSSGHSTWPVTLLSVRNVVPTLTSNKRQDLSLNGRC